MAAAASSSGTGYTDILERGESLDSGEREGASAIARFIGKDGICLWNGVQEAVRMHYGNERMLEVRKTVFRLAWKATSLYARGKLKDVDVFEINDPLMEAMATLFHTVTADSGSRAINVFPLSTRIAALHDALLVVLRRYVKENAMKPELALSLTNTFIGVGNESFLNPLMNSEAYESPRAKLADATARLLHKFRHPSFLAGPPREKRCKVAGCFHPRTYGGMCIDHGLAKHKKMLKTPSLRHALSDMRKLSAFAKWVKVAHPDALRLHALWRSCLAYRDTTSASLRLVKARSILSKHLSADAMAAPVALATAEAATNSRALSSTEADLTASGTPTAMECASSPAAAAAVASSAGSRKPGLSGSESSKRRTRFSSSSASLTWMPANVVASIRKAVAEAEKWEHTDRASAEAAAVRYISTPHDGTDRSGTGTGSGGPLPSRPQVCSKDLFLPIEAEAFDRLDMLFQREYSETPGYAETMVAISQAITTPRTGYGMQTGEGAATAAGDSDAASAEAAPTAPRRAD